MTDQPPYLVYIFDPDDMSRWVAVGLVDDREERDEWWHKVQTGEIELPDRYGGWWCSDTVACRGLWGMRE